VRERRKGPISIAGGLVDSVAATVRRMQRDREPRALAYDPTGYARLIQPEARGHARILEIAEAMIAQAGSDAAAEPRGEAGSQEPSPRARKATGPAKSRKIAGRAAEPAAKTRSGGTAKAKPAAGSAKPRARRAARPKKK
jgi:hypothetical protein